MSPTIFELLYSVLRDIHQSDVHYDTLSLYNENIEISNGAGRVVLISVNDDETISVRYSDVAFEEVFWAPIHEGEYAGLSAIGLFLGNQIYLDSRGDT